MKAFIGTDSLGIVSSICCHVFHSRGVERKKRANTFSTSISFQTFKQTINTRNLNIFEYLDQSQEIV